MQNQDEIKSSGKDLRIIISGGGSGGHIFPAIAIANHVKEMIPLAELIFVGATGKIEMKKVPEAGYQIHGLPIRGWQRKFTWTNLTVPFRLIYSLFKAYRLLRKVKPQVAVGVGGYASFPILFVARLMNIKTLVQEQNSYAGVANKLLQGKADKYCVAYEGMNKYFPKDKIILTGNPVRATLGKVLESKKDAKVHFGLSPELPTVFLTGGSLGAQSLNEAFIANHEMIAENNAIQWLWQVGSLYEDRFKNSSTAKLPNVKMTAFVDKMDLAYKLADVVICRAGASTVSEICLLGKAVVLVPSPNVAEDHQTKNAKSLVEKNAAVLVEDKFAKEQMIEQTISLLRDPKKIETLSQNAKSLGRPKATQEIVEEILKLAIRK